MQSFSIKELTVNIIMGQGGFGGTGSGKEYSKHAIDVSIEKVGLPDTPKAQITIYNMLLDDMEQLTTLAFKPLEIENNIVQIFAHVDNVKSLVFEGEIISATADFNPSPDIEFNIEAQAGHYPQLTAIPATASEGEVKLSEVISKLASQAGYTFKDEGLSVFAKDIYLAGSPIDQIKHAAREYDFEVLIDDGEVIAMQKGATRQNNGNILISTSTGLLGYPSFTSNGLNVTTIFNNEYKIGAMVEVESIVPKASGQWKITKLSHKLSTVTGGGEWLSELELYYVK